MRNRRRSACSAGFARAARHRAPNRLLRPGTELRPTGETPRRHEPPVERDADARARLRGHTPGGARERIAIQPPEAAQTHTEAMDVTNDTTTENADAEGRPARAGYTERPYVTCTVCKGEGYVRRVVTVDVASGAEVFIDATRCGACDGHGRRAV